MDINNLWSGYDLNSKKQNSRCLAVNTILEGKYLVGPVLGQGGFGITYVGYDLNMEAKVAIKEYFPVELVSRDTTTMHGDRVLSLSGEKSVTYKAGLKKYVAEAQNVSQFSEIPGVVSVKDFFYANETAYIVMEFIDGISLKDYLKEKGGRLTEEETLKIMKPVLEALVQVHKSGIIHRDISPDNIMLTFKDRKAHNQIQSVKLIDFGAARMTAKNDQKSLTIILKHGYAPEEQYRTHGEQGPWTDVYALCAVLYRMLTGETPVPAMDRMFQDELKTLKALHANVSENTEAAILKGLAVKKDDRIQSVQELIAILYDGAKVAKKKVKESNKKSVVMAAAAAVAAVGIVGAFFLFSGDKKETSGQSILNQQQEETILADQTNATVEVSGETIAVDFAEKEEEKKKIIGWSSLTSVDNSNNHAVFALKDGIIASFGMNTYGQRELDDWQDIAAVAVGNTFSAGLCEDGTVYVAGQLIGKDEVERWENIVAISAFDDVLYGLSDDGTIAASKVDEDTKSCLDWTDIMAISAWDGVFFGLTEDGTLLRTASDLTPCEITGWEDVDYIFCNDTYIVGQVRRGEAYSEVLWEEKKENAWGLGLNGGSYNGFAQFNFSTNGDTDYNGVTNQGEVRGSHFYDVRDLGWTETNELVGITSIYDGKCAVGIKEDGTILISTPKNETELLAELSNMKIARVFSNSPYVAPSVIGVAGDGQLVGYSLGDETWLSELINELETSGMMSEIKEIEEVQGAYATLDANGTIRIQVSNLQIIEGMGMLPGELTEQDIQDLEPQPYLFKVADGIKQMSVASMNADLNNYVIGLSEEGTVHIYDDNQAVISRYFTDAYMQMLDSFLPESEVSKLDYGMVEKLWRTIVGDEEVDRLLNIKIFDAAPETFRIVEEWTGIKGIAGFVDRNTMQRGLIGLNMDGTVQGVLEDGSQIESVKKWTNVKSLYEGAYSVGAITEDGYALFLEDTSENNYGQYNTAGWSELESLALGNYHTAGLKKDGTVCAVGRNDNGQCDVEEWQDIVYISVSDGCTLGITSDGELKIAGEFGYGQTVLEGRRSSLSSQMNVEKENQIAFYHPQNSMAASWYGLLICKPDGTVVFKGEDSYGEGNVEDWTDIVSVELTGYHALGLRSDGTVLAAGSNDGGQCDVESWSDVVQISADNRVSLGVTKDGNVLVAGKSNEIDLSQLAAWSDIKAVAVCAESYGGIVGVKSDGTVVTIPAEGSSWDPTIQITGWENMEGIYLNGEGLCGIDPNGRYVEARLVSWGDNYYDYYPDIKQKGNAGCVTTDGYLWGDLTEYKELRSWDCLVSVEVMFGTYYGLREDGTILEYFPHAGNAELEDFKELEWAARVNESMDHRLGLLGRTKNGELLYYGMSQGIADLLPQLEQMDKIIDVGEGYTNYFLFEDGTVRKDWMFEEVGASDIEQVAYYDYEPLGLCSDGTIVSIYGEDIPEQVSSWSDIVQIGGDNTWIYGLKSDGTVISTEDNFKEVSNIKQIAVSSGLCLGLKDDGTVVELSEAITEKMTDEGYYINLNNMKGVEEISVGLGHVAGLRADGTVSASGLNDYGQCDVEDWTDIIYLDASDYCTLGITKDGELKIAGELLRD